MSTYCVDTDLLKYRSNILSFGITSWEDQRKEAFSDINRLLVARWYNQVASTQGIDPTLVAFDPAKVQEGSLTKLECFKTLEYAYMILMKDSPEADGFERNMSLFSKLFDTEFDTVINLGLSYDWDNSGEIDDSEQLMRAPRRLKRA